MTVSVATFNFGARGRIPDADVIGCQEAGDQGDMIRAWEVAHPFGELYNGTGKQGRGKTPILYDTAVVERIAGSTPRILERTYSPRGAGGPYIDNKYAVTAHFGLLTTGAEFTHINGHAPPSLWDPKRLRLHKTFCENLTDHAAGITGPCVITLDANCRWSHRHLNGLRALGFRLDNPPGPTHPKTKRQIDLVMSRG